VRAARRATPDPLAKPEYVVVWSSHVNASDENYQTTQDDSGALGQNPALFANDAQARFVPGLDGWEVLDARKHNPDGSANPGYGKVVNFVQLPLPWGVETEAHHMQYQWNDGDPLLAGGLFNDTTFIADVTNIPSVKLVNTITPLDTPGGSVPDAYDGAGHGRFIGTYMGGPNTNFAGSPGEVVAFKPDPEKGLVVASETPGGRVDATEIDNDGGVPEPCNDDEGFPENTCANPHGVQVRPDLHRMITSDYGQPRAVVTDPVKPDGGRFFRPTVRIWDTKDPDHPKLISVAHMPRGWRTPQDVSTMHLNRGIMENAKTWPRTRSFPRTLRSKGHFAGAMCGGGVFFTPDVTKLKADSSKQWNEVWDDGFSLLSARGGRLDDWIDDSGPCEGGAWTQTSRDNHWLFRIVTGQQPNQENLQNRGQPVKILYSLNIKPLIRSAQDGRVTCDLANGMDLDRDGTVDLTPQQAFTKLASGERVADCPRLLSTLIVDDTTSGGPHWGAIDNHSLTARGAPTRLVFSDYFVARSGVDGNHKMFMVDVDPHTGKLSYDETWRDEITGKLGINFNRKDWPGNPGAGFYKPHSMVWVCPPHVCPNDKPGVGSGP